MQSLWARAGQAHRCGCRACSTAVGAVGKRATSAAGRRKATFAEIFTACYSSVFATAAVVDALRKDERRKELDRQLEEAKRELSELRQRSSKGSAKTESADSDLSIHQMDALWKSLKEIYINRPFMKEIDKPATIDKSELVAELTGDYYNAADEPSLRALGQIDYEKLEKAIMAEERNTRISFRESLTQAQLLRESQTVEGLVQQLLYRAEILDNNATTSASFDEARGLAAKGYPKFSFRSIDPVKASRNTSTLNTHIRALVETEDLSWKEKIGRVCYNLLVSAHPPDMHTYNTLIVAFDKSGHHAFSDALVHSFFYRLKLKPTPSTFTAILNHYKLTNNHGQFLRTLACLAGLDGQSGGKVGRRHVQDVENWGMETWAANTKMRTRTGDWFWEHVPLNVPLVESVLNGLLHFKLFDEAASFFVSCMRSGVALSTRAVRQVFDECVAALDWRAAVRLVQGLSDSRKRWERLLSQEDDHAAAHLVGRVFALIDLCGLGTHDQQPSERCLANLNISGPKLNQLLESLSRVNQLLLDVNPDSLQTQNATGDTGFSLSKSRVLQFESMWKEYKFVRKTTASIESKLLYPEFSPTFRASLAMHIGTTAVQKSLILAQELDDAWPPNETRPQELTQAICDGQVLDGQGLVEEMEAMTINDKRVEHQEEGPEPREAATSSMVARGWNREQNQAISDGLRFKPRGLLAWQRPSHRTVYAEERRQWAVGS
jgi:hypothetical protein